MFKYLCALSLALIAMPTYTMKRGRELVDLTNLPPALHFKRAKPNPVKIEPSSTSSYSVEDGKKLEKIAKRIEKCEAFQLAEETVRPGKLYGMRHPQKRHNKINADNEIPIIEKDILKTTSQLPTIQDINTKTNTPQGRLLIFLKAIEEKKYPKSIQYITEIPYHPLNIAFLYAMDNPQDYPKNITQVLNNEDYSETFKKNFRTFLYGSLKSKSKLPTYLQSSEEFNKHQKQKEATYRAIHTPSTPRKTTPNTTPRKTTPNTPMPKKINRSKK